MMSYTTHRHARHIGAAMMELVMVLPLIAVILAMLFYLGRTEVRVQRALQMARYETWRAAADGPGPHADEVRGHPLLNQTFFAGNASRIGAEWYDDDRFEGGAPHDPADRFIEAGRSVSDDAGIFAEAYIWQPGANDDAPRNSSGVNRAFRVRHNDDVDDWTRIGRVWQRAEYDFQADNPGNQDTLRRCYRQGSDWAYTNDWRASAPTFADTGGVGELNHLRAVRDAFYEDFDAFMDEIDGSASTEYSGDPTQVPAGNFAGTLRGLYLDRVGYRGPNVGVN